MGPLDTIKSTLRDFGNFLLVVVGCGGSCGDSGWGGGGGGDGVIASGI